MQKEIKRNKVEIDATGMSVGRLSTQVAKTLMGKIKPGYLPYIDSGDYVRVLNCSQVKFTGRKLVQKDFRHHSMHPGGLKEISMKRVFDTNPCKVVEHAVYGMLPKNRTRDEFMKRLTLKK